jgi:propanediol dehydratase small subunit
MCAGNSNKRKTTSVLSLVFVMCGHSAPHVCVMLVQYDATVDALNGKTKEAAELKELYDVGQETIQRLHRNVRAGKDREEELLTKLQQMEQNMEQFRRCKIELKEAKARLFIQDAEVSRVRLR